MGYPGFLYFLVTLCRASVVHYCLLENECTRYLHFVPITHITFCCFLVILFLLKHGLWTPNETFIHWNPELLGLGRQIGHIDSGTFSAFSAKLSAFILVQRLSFPLFKHYFYKKLSLYIQLPNIYIWVGFDFGPQRLWDSAFVYP